MTAMPKAMVLAAGLGLRMRPLTEHAPKPLVPVAGRALIDHALDWLAASGVEEAVVNSHYLAEMLKAHLSQRRCPRVRLLYEEAALDTGGGIRNALPYLGEEPFFSVNSDTICVDGKIPALRRLLEYWNDAAMDALLLLHPVEGAVGYSGPGDFFMNEGGILTRRGSAKAAPFVFTGIQLIHPRLFADAPSGAFSLNLLYDRALTRIRGIAHDGGWLHVGDLEGLRQAEEFLADKEAPRTKSR